MKTIIEHKQRGSRKNITHTIWEHHEGLPMYLVGEPIHLTHQQYLAMERHFNGNRSELLNRIHDLERQLDAARGEYRALLSLVGMIEDKYNQLLKKYGGDHPLNNLMNII